MNITVSMNGQEPIPFMAKGEETKGNMPKSVSLAHKAEDPIAKRKEKAFEKARKIVSDAFEGEKKIDAAMQEIRDLSAMLIEDNKEKLDQINSNKDEMTRLRDIYGVTPDSEEQKDLELLMKQNDAQYDPSVRLTKEENERYKEISQKPMTEYQSRMMERHTENNRLNSEIRENLDLIRANTSVLRSVKQERLKSSPIKEAKDAARQVFEAEMDAITGEIVSGAMEHVQEDLEEKVEEAKEAAEEAAEKKAEEEEISSVTEDVLLTQQKIQTEIDKILEELKLLSEDLKGNAIDKLL